MGSLMYDGFVVHLDDRTLTHLQIVIVNKLRRGDSFVMSWKDDTEAGNGRSAVWLHPHMLLHFKFDGGKVPSVNPEWLATLAASAESSRGLVITAEDGYIPQLEAEPRRAPTVTVVRPVTASPVVAPDFDLDDARQ
ncbi:MAG TPA: ATP-dependent DNA ligase [Galbitalea sp.]